MFCWALWVSWLECSCYFFPVIQNNGEYFQGKFDFYLFSRNRNKLCSQKRKSFCRDLLFLGKAISCLIAVVLKKNCLKKKTSWWCVVCSFSFESKCTKIKDWIQFLNDFWSIWTGQKERSIINWQNFMYHEIVGVFHLLSSASVLKCSNDCILKIKLWI